MHRVLVVNGPNLNLLGTRAPDIYGSTTYPELEALLEAWGDELGIDVDAFQSNHEGTLIDRLHAARSQVDAIVLNPGALTHYSYALHDAVEALDIPVVEVHISNIKAREAWRRHSVIAAACESTIYGRGVEGYRWAMHHLVAHAAWPVETIRYGEADDHIADLRLPRTPGPHPVAVVIHGGFWKDVWMRDLMDRVSVDLPGRGWATWNIEYRRVGTGGGWPATFEDVAAAIDVLATFGHDLDLARVVTVGHSAGGHLAVWAAARPRLGSDAPGGPARVAPVSAVSLAGVLDLELAHRLDLGEGAVEAMMRRSPDSGSDRYVHADLAGMVPIGVPMRIVQGSEDRVVPAEIGRVFVEKAVQAGDDATLIEVPDTGHFDFIDPKTTAWASVLSALEIG